MSRSGPTTGTAGVRACTTPAHQDTGGDAVRMAVARLESAAIALRAVLAAPDADAAARAAGAPAPAGRAALDEELCDRLVELVAARAWAEREAASAPAAGPGEDAAAAVLRGCALWAVRADTLRASTTTGTAGEADGAAAAVAAHGRAAALVTALARADVYDAVCAGLRAALGGRPDRLHVLRLVGLLRVAQGDAADAVV
ncbi:hypothetical protein ACWEFK_30955, partial [Streptomyces sp. NPDC004830]